LYESHDEPRRFRNRAKRERPSPVALIAGEQDFWVVLAGADDPVDPTDGTESAEASACPPTRMCRAVLNDGRLAMGDVDPVREQLLSEILGTS
jgi:hypothetical protein